MEVLLVKVYFVARMNPKVSTEERQKRLEFDHYLKNIGIRNVVCQNNPPYAEESFEVDDVKGVWHNLFMSCLTCGDISVPEKDIHFHVPAKC